MLVTYVRSKYFVNVISWKKKIYVFCYSRKIRKNDLGDYYITVLKVMKRKCTFFKEKITDKSSSTTPRVTFIRFFLSHF